MKHAHVLLVGLAILLNGVIHVAQASPAALPDAQPQDLWPSGAKVPSSGSTSSECVRWTTLDPGSPPIRAGAVTIYDPIRQRMIRFGGYSLELSYEESFHNDVQVLDLTGPSDWTALAAEGEPPPPRCRGAIYDSIRDRMLLFFDGVDNVWALSLSGTSAWSRLPTIAAPEIGGEFGLAFDPVRDRAIVVGGSTDEDGVVRNTWELSLADLTWHGLPEGPLVEHETRAIYDPGRDRLVVIGDEYNASGWPGVLGPVWELSLGDAPAWTERSPIGPRPSQRVEFSTAFDPVGERLLVFGGHVPSHFDVLNDVWQLSVAGSNPVWEPVMASNPPHGRSRHAAIFDPPRHRMIIFGGLAFSDTWQLVLDGSPRWEQLSEPDRRPEPRYSMASVWDGPRNRLVVFGGSGVVDPVLGDLFTVTLTDPPAWMALAPSGPSPSPRYFAASVLDAERERMIVFGGEAIGSQKFGDVWALDLAGPSSWTLLAGPEAGPGLLSGATAVCDPTRDRMIVFGGADTDFIRHNESWSFDLVGHEWRRLMPGGARPPGLEESMAVYDAIRDRMIVIGGYTQDGKNLNSAWALSLASEGSWLELSPLGDPPPQEWGGSAVYDPIRDRVLVFQSQGHLVGSQVYILDLTDPPMWSIAGATTAQAGRHGHAAAFDADHDRMIVFGGNDDAGYGLNDLITMTVTDAVPLTIDIEPPGTGSVTVDPAGASCYVVGSEVTLTARPSADYVFAGWGGDASGTANPIGLALDEAKHVVATFVPNYTAALLSEFEATEIEGGVQLRWRFATPDRVSRVQIERGTREDGPWEPLAVEVRESGGVTEAFDANVGAQGPRFYRLRVTLADAAVAIFGPIEARRDEVVIANRLLGISPNPSHDVTRIEFAVARETRVRLDVLDASGRRIAKLVDAVYRPGRHQALWNGADMAGRTAPGVYFLCFDAAKQRATRRLVLRR